MKIALALFVGCAACAEQPAPRVAQEPPMPKKSAPPAGPPVKSPVSAPGPAPAAPPSEASAAPDSAPAAPPLEAAAPGSTPATPPPAQAQDLRAYLVFQDNRQVGVLGSVTGPFLSARTEGPGRPRGPRLAGFRFTSLVFTGEKGRRELLGRARGFNQAAELLRQGGYRLEPAEYAEQFPIEITPEDELRDVERDLRQLNRDL